MKRHEKIQAEILSQYVDLLNSGDKCKPESFIRTYNLILHDPELKKLLKLVYKFNITELVEPLTPEKSRELFEKMRLKLREDGSADRIIAEGEK